jgi:hypothetical protein
VKAVFTVNLSSYDTVLSVPKWDGFESVLITDGEPDNRFDVNIIVNSVNPYLESRYYKWMSHDWGRQYSSVIYFDANLKLKKKPSQEVFRIMHGERSSVLEECNALIAQGHRYDEESIMSQYHWMVSEGFPDKSGLYLNSLFGRLHDEKNNLMCESTYNICRDYTNRDMMALPFVLWRHSMSVDGLVSRSFFSKFVIRKMHKRKHELLSLTKKL